jgi:hypothetical protein
MAEPQSRVAPPGGGERPPAAPGTGEPDGLPDPADPGPPIMVKVNGVPLGDLGHPRVDSRLVMAVLLRGAAVAQWLAGRGVDRAAVESAFPGCGWPLEPPLSWPESPPQPSDRDAHLGVELDSLRLDELGTEHGDARLLWAVTSRAGRVSAWLNDHQVDANAIERAFPGSGWS